MNQLEKVEQQITLSLSNIDGYFSGCVQIASNLLDKSKVYIKKNEEIHHSLFLWKEFFQQFEVLKIGIPEILNEKGKSISVGGDCVMGTSPLPQNVPPKMHEFSPPKTPILEVTNQLTEDVELLATPTMPELSVYYENTSTGCSSSASFIAPQLKSDTSSLPSSLLEPSNVEFPTYPSFSLDIFPPVFRENEGAKQLTHIFQIFRDNVGTPLSIVNLKHRLQESSIFLTEDFIGIFVDLLISRGFVHPSSPSSTGPSFIFSGSVSTSSCS